MKKIILIDNYDSFTYNLVHLIEEIVGHTIDVIKNDQVDLEKLDRYDYFFLSPGPGLPEEAGLLSQIIDKYKSSKKILGVCLGLQAIAESYGGKLKILDKVFHGIKSNIGITHPSILYTGIAEHFSAGRYHSWVMDEEDNQGFNELIVTAVSVEGHIMSLEHSQDAVYGVQYHPESFMTNEGKTIITNFLERS